MIAIIILSHNDAKFVQPCIDSIKKNTNEKYEITLIDNGSNEYNAQILNKIRGVSWFFVKGENVGFPAGNNAGIEQAMKDAADYVCLLNADTIIKTKGWLENLLKVFEEKEDAGLVSAMTNYAANKWQDIKRFGNKLPGGVIEAEEIIFYFVMIPKKVIEEVGLLDERFGYGCSEDTDYSIRVKRAGYKLYVDGNTEIFHYGGMGFKQLPISFDELLKKNRKLLEEKWKDEPDIQSPK